MSDYWVRRGAKVNGPMSVADLKAGIASGQILRTDEVSPDQQRWRIAGTIRELFAEAEAMPAGPPPNVSSNAPAKNNTKLIAIIAGAALVALVVSLYFVFRTPSKPAEIATARSSPASQTPQPPTAGSDPAAGNSTLPAAVDKGDVTNPAFDVSVKSSQIAVTGTAKFAERFQRDINMEFTWAEWKLDLSCENRTPYSLTFDNELVLINTFTDGSYGGFVRVRGPSRARTGLTPGRFPNSSYRVKNYESTDGAENTGVSGMYSKGSGKHPENSGFQQVKSQKPMAIGEVMKLTEWVSDEKQLSLCVALPVAIVQTQNKEHRFGIIVHFQKMPGQPGHWSVQRHDCYALETDDVLALLAAKEDAGIRVVAANWIAASRKDAPSILAKQGALLREGPVLAAILDLMQRLNAGDMADHALNLLKDQKVPNGIASGAGEYLAGIQDQRALAILIERSESADLKVAWPVVDQGQIIWPLKITVCPIFALFDGIG